jgi:hypothetical protein
MSVNIIYYALKQLEIIGIDCGFKPIYDGNGIYIEFKSGKTLRLSECEIKYQATEYLKSELEMINF